MKVKGVKVHVEFDWRVWLFGMLFDPGDVGVFFGPVVIGFNFVKEHN